MNLEALDQVLLFSVVIWKHFKHFGESESLHIGTNTQLDLLEGYSVFVENQITTKVRRLVEILVDTGRKWH